jgi:hypothetical protein
MARVIRRWRAKDSEHLCRDVIADDMARAVGYEWSRLVLTGRTEQLVHLETALTGRVQNVIVLKGEWAASNDVRSTNAWLRSPSLNRD